MGWILKWRRSNLDARFSRLPSNTSVAQILAMIQDPIFKRFSGDRTYSLAARSLCEASGPDKADALEKLLIEPHGGGAAAAQVAAEFDNPELDRVLAGWLERYGGVRQNVESVVNRFERIPIARCFTLLFPIAVNSFLVAWSSYAFLIVNKRLASAAPGDLATVVQVAVASKPQIKNRFNLEAVHSLAGTCARRKLAEVLPLLELLGNLHGIACYTRTMEDWEDASYKPREKHVDSVGACMSLYFHLAAHLGLIDLIRSRMSGSFASQAQEVFNKEFCDRERK